MPLRTDVPRCTIPCRAELISLLHSTPSCLLQGVVLFVIDGEKWTLDLREGKVRQARDGQCGMGGGAEPGYG